jgi:hypothetical protein
MAMVERAEHNKEESINTNDAAAHWHDHFSDDVGKAEAYLNDQVLCFFNLAQGAGLGTFTLGRKGNPTRFVWDLAAVTAFTSTTDLPEKEHGPASGAADQRGVNSESGGSGDSDGNGSPSSAPVSSSEPAGKKLGSSIFLAHGKNKIPLEQLEKILRQFNIPFKAAIYEPNLGRPIGAKVRAIMQDCNCAILIFTADEQLTDKDGNEIWRPSENVVHELGACGYLYDNRIVIIKEGRVNFPSNFRDLGYIPFSLSSGGLDAKAMDILKELIGFNIVKVST